MNTNYTIPNCTAVDVGQAPPATGCANWTVDAGQDLQTALNNARRGDRISLGCGATFNGPFTLPSKAGTGWIYITPGDACIGRLPARGNRVIPDDLTGPCDTSTGLYCGAPAPNFPVAIMPTVVGDSEYPHVAIYSATGADSYVVMGIRAKAPAGRWTSGLIRTYSSDSSDPGVNDIIFDRIYAPGDPIAGGGRAVTIVASRIAVTNSYLNNWWDTDSDTQGVLVCYFSHGVAIINNYVEATGENLYSDLCGDGDATSNPTDIEVRWNYLRKPTDWRNRPGWFNTKNLWETKSGNRVLIEGNVFADSWGDGAQETAMNIKTGDEDPDKHTANHTVRKNAWRRVGNAVKICLNGDSGCNSPGLKGERDAIYNNIMEVDGARYGRGVGMDGYCAYQFVSAGDRLIFANNTCLNGTGSIVGLAIKSDSGTPGDGWYVNNIGNAGENPFTTSEANAMWGRGYVYQGNVQVGGNLGNYPAGNSCPASWAAVGFVSYNGGVGGDYRLSTSSPYRGACVDYFGIGTTDCGANVDVVNNAISCVVSGECASWRRLQ